ncbi:hypothetical protein DRN58_08470, partial [Thermococci archaeon]
YDIAITLDEIRTSSAKLTFEAISEPVPQKEEEVEKEVIEIPPKEEELTEEEKEKVVDFEEQKKFNWIPYAIAAVIALILIAIFIKKLKKLI